MSDGLVERVARVIGDNDFAANSSAKYYERFARAAIAVVVEECAKAADEQADECDSRYPSDTARIIANSIRKLGEAP